jgi:hypothetical protein
LLASGGSMSLWQSTSGSQAMRQFGGIGGPVLRTILHLSVSGVRSPRRNRGGIYAVLRSGDGILSVLCDGVGVPALLLSAVGPMRGTTCSGQTCGRSDGRSVWPC